jgi:DNA-binding MarR family transcriptional regulator
LSRTQHERVKGAQSARRVALRVDSGDKIRSPASSVGPADHARQGQSMAKPALRSDQTAPEAVANQVAHPFDEYLGAKVITLATLLRRSTAIRYQRMFGMTMVESRVILRVGVSGPLSLDQLAAHVAIGKSQTSRVVSELVQRGLVDRSRDPNQQRGVAITLTDEGRIINRALVEAASLRNAELMTELEPDRLEAASRLMDELIARARTLLARDQERPAARSDDDYEEVYEDL